MDITICLFPLISVAKEKTAHTKLPMDAPRNITGPDKNGIKMLDGGVTILDTGNNKWIGPGGQDVYNNNILVRHAYNANSNVLPCLLINDLYWDSSGCPRY